MDNSPGVCTRSIRVNVPGKQRLPWSKLAATAASNYSGKRSNPAQNLVWTVEEPALREVQSLLKAKRIEIRVRQPKVQTHGLSRPGTDVGGFAPSDSLINCVALQRAAVIQ